MNYPQTTWVRWPARTIPRTVSYTNSEIGEDLLEEFKDHMRVTGAANDAVFVRGLDTTATKFEEETDRLLITGTVTEYYDLWPLDYYNCWQLHRAPVSSVTHIKYYDGDGNQQTWNSANYQTDVVSTPARIVLDPSATTTSPSLEEKPNAVEVAYSCGYGSTVASIPSEIINAIFIYAAWLVTSGRELQAGVVEPQEIARHWDHLIRHYLWRAV